MYSLFWSVNGQSYDQKGVKVLLGMFRHFLV